MKEVWKDISGFENLYQVSNLGRVKSLSRKILISGYGIRPIRKRILKPSKTIHGYLSVCLCRSGDNARRLIHRIALEAFVGISDLDCDHINGIKSDNRLTNLEYVSHRENSIRHFSKQRASSKYVGVHYVKKERKYMARIQINGTRRVLGGFKYEVDAHLAYQTALSNHLKQSA